MFTTKEATLERIDYEVTSEELAVAQTMIEALVGRLEEDVTEESDRAILGRATMFQAAFLHSNGEVLFDQIPMKSMSLGETGTVYDTDMLSPYYSFYAVMLCRKVSWMGTRSLHTGPIFDTPPTRSGWERD